MDQTVSEDGHLTAKQYFAMAECGIISPDERVELLDGLIVAMPPQSPWHAATISRVEQALRKKLGPEVYVRIQTTFPLDENSVPEPDLAVVPGHYADYYLEHPTDAHLFVEVAHTSVLQDRITKSAIYARRGIPCYWLVNLRDRCVEVFREPDRWKSSYTSVVRFMGSQTFGIDAFPGIEFEADELLPPPDARLP